MAHFFVRDKYRQPVHTPPPPRLNSSYPASLHPYPEPGLLSDTSSLLLPPRRRGYYRTNAPSSLVPLLCNPRRETLSRLVLQPLPWFIRQVLWITIVQAVPGSAHDSVFGSYALKSGGYCRSMTKWKKKKKRGSCLLTTWEMQFSAVKSRWKAKKSVAWNVRVYLFRAQNAVCEAQSYKYPVYIQLRFIPWTFLLTPSWSGEELLAHTHCLPEHLCSHMHMHCEHKCHYFVSSLTPALPCQPPGIIPM